MKVGESQYIIRKWPKSRTKKQTKSKLNIVISLSKPRQIQSIPPPMSSFKCILYTTIPQHFLIKSYHRPLLPKEAFLPKGSPQRSHSTTRGACHNCIEQDRFYKSLPIATSLKVMATLRCHGPLRRRLWQVSRGRPVAMFQRVGPSCPIFKHET